jgi:hypothetical protein
MGSMIIPLEWRDFIFPDKRVCIEGEWFEPKGELHVTVISTRAGRILGGKMSQVPMMEAQVRQEFESIDWRFEPAGPVHIISRSKEKPGKEPAKRRHEKTITLRLNMPGMTAFHEALKALDLISVDTLIPPPHLTLYTLNCPVGIGLANNKVLDDLTCRILTTREFDDLCQCS